MVEDTNIEGFEVEPADDVLEFNTEDVDSNVDAENDFWSAFEDEKADSLSTVWFCDVSFELETEEDTSQIARDVFACTTKEKVVNRIFAIISSPDLAGLDFDASSFVTKHQAIRAFFDNIEGRNLFVGLVPVY